MSDHFQQLRALEALLFAASEPQAPAVLARVLPEDAKVEPLLEELAGLYANRGVHLTRVGDGYAFRTADDLAHLFAREQTVQKKLTRAAIECLAIVAYHQPATRAEIEEIRGVALSKGTLDTLLEAGWIRPGARREAPGRPVTWLTTAAFLDHFGLEDLGALPGVEDLKAAGLLDPRPAVTALSERGLLAALPRDGAETSADRAEAEAEADAAAEELLADDFGEDLMAEEGSDAAASAGGEGQEGDGVDDDADAGADAGPDDEPGEDDADADAVTDDDDEVRRRSAAAEG